MKYFFLIEGRGVVWGWKVQPGLWDVMRQSEGSWQGAALQGVVMGTQQVGHPPRWVLCTNSGDVVA